MTLQNNKQKIFLPCSAAALKAANYVNEANDNVLPEGFEGLDFTPLAIEVILSCIAWDSAY
jgi:hypothetical protein